MSIPLSFLRTLTGPSAGASLGEFLSDNITGKVTTLLDCLCSTPEPAFHSPDSSRPPLCHNEVHAFVSDFALPHSASRPPLGPNDRVIVVLPNGPENALALIAVASYHTCAPLNASCTAVELADDARRLGAKAVVTTKEVEERLGLRPLQAALGCDIIYIHGRSSGPAGLFDISLMGDEALPMDRSRKPSRLHGLTDQSLVLHTSGTSGKKKVVPYALRSLIVGTWSVVQSWDLQRSDVNMNMMPLFHVGGIIRNLWAPLLSGGSTIMCSGFDAITFWNLATELKATWYYAAPTIHHAILMSRPDAVVPHRDLRVRMICNAAGGLLPSLAAELKDTFVGAAILPSYGMTECMPIASPPTDYQLDRPGCSGIACGPHLSIRDPDDLDCELPYGKTGAVSVRGIPTFDGYEITPDITLPLDTSAFSSEGWFDSGDVGYMDTDGYLYITGRSKEIINKGGEVISPFEVEEAIVTAAKGYVKNVLAFALEHDVLQETIGVVLVPVSGRPRIGLAQLQDLLKDHLHPSKWPFAVVYMEDIPKNSSGKPLRIKLSTRLGIGRLTDSIPLLHRHFEADVPSTLASLSDPIPCSRVTLDLQTIDRVLRDISGVQEVALRSRHDGSLEAFVTVDEKSGLCSADIGIASSRVLPGYGVPDPLHLLTQPLVRDERGQVDLDIMEQEATRRGSLALSDQELLVRDIVCDLLPAEPGKVNRNSDFFLLGGNSLLLGKLSYLIRRQTGTDVGVAKLFNNSTIRGIASLIKNGNVPAPNDGPGHEPYRNSVATSEATITPEDDQDLEDLEEMTSYDQCHPVCLIVQAIPILFFYPLKTAFTWTILLFVLSYLVKLIDGSFWQRLLALLTAIFAARTFARILCPLAAVAFKWMVIGKYKPGTYRMWSTYYLRWWIVNQSLRAAGRGVFSMHSSLEILYYRMLGARIGKNVYIDKQARLGEYDLITLHDGCRIDTSLVRGFCVEREGFFRLDNITIGRRAVINTHTMIAPGANIPDRAVYGPHASSHDPPSPKFYAAYNRTWIAQPHWSLQAFVAWPIIVSVIFISYIPWMVMIWLMIHETVVAKDGLSSLVAVIYWFASPRRVVFHTFSRIVRAIAAPLLQLLLGIVIKRAFGLNRECPSVAATQLSLLRRYINSALLSQQVLKEAFSILGSHYEIVSVVFRMMGAKVGRRVYWPGTGFYCLDPELLDIGDDVVFGSRSELFTTDKNGSAKITIGNGAMIADRVVLLPGTRVGRNTIMGSGALGKRNGVYEDGSTWMGSERGEAICFNDGTKDVDNKADTTTPFGRAYYDRKANYFVFPYSLILAVNVVVAALSAAYWSIGAVAAAQLLRSIHIHFRHLQLFKPHWYRIAILYSFIAACFIVVLTLQALASLLWVVLTKWIVIGRRRAGRYEWDRSSYCQRWQLHLVLSRFMYKGYGNGGVLGPLTGSVYIVWYLRALGAKIGKNCAIFASGRVGLMTEPDLVEIGNDVNLDDCSVVAHINSRGNFALNNLKIGDGCAMRSGSRLLSGASMEDSSMLSEHTLLTSGEVAESGAVYVGWPARQPEKAYDATASDKRSTLPASSRSAATLMCPMCREFPKDSTVTSCGHLFCGPCITRAVADRGKCPICMASAPQRTLKRVHLSFAI